MASLRRLLILTAFFSLEIASPAQVPNAFKYQAVVRDSEGKVIASQGVTFEVSLRKGSANGHPVYTETHYTQTEANGIVNIKVGHGITNDQFSAINWSDGPFFIQISINGVIMGSSQLLSVPYAMHAGSFQVMKNGQAWTSHVSDDGSILAIPPVGVIYPDKETPSVNDYDGNTYTTVNINGQIWMGENMKTTHYADGTPIPLVTDSYQWALLPDSNSNRSKAYCWYDNNPQSIYGALYTYAAATKGDNSGIDVQGICPDGWRLPSDKDWAQLTDSLGSIPGGRLKEKGFTHWDQPNTDATNDTRFLALPGGSRSCSHGGFANAGYHGYWWTATEASMTTAKSRSMYFHNASVFNYYLEKSYGFSVRCIKQ